MNRSSKAFLKKRLVLVFMIFMGVLGVGVLIGLLQPQITGLTFGIPEESNFTQAGSIEQNISETTNLQAPLIILENETAGQEIVAQQKDEFAKNSISEQQLGTTSEQRFGIQADTVSFLPNVPDNGETKHLGYKHSNYSNVVISSKSEISCRIKPDTEDDGWKTCSAILEVENMKAAKPNIKTPSIAFNFTKYAPIKNKVITFSNESSLINESFISWDVVNNNIVKNVTIFEKRNFTNFTSMPSVIVTATPFAIKLEYEAMKFSDNQFNLSIKASGFSAFIDPDQTACGTLSSAGTYTVDRNLNSTGTCFTIDSNYVDLNCNGYIVNFSTSAATGSYGITFNNNYNHTRIRNCNMFEGNQSSSSSSGIRAIVTTYSLENITIGYNNITTYSNGSTGIESSGGGRGITGSNISGNTITTTAGEGIYFYYNSSHNNITLNTINTSFGARVYPINIRNSTYTLIAYNTLYTYGGGSHTIRVTDNSWNNNITNNTATETNGQYNLNLDINASSNSITYNTFIGNSSIYCGGNSSFNIIHGNKIDSYGDDGMFLNECDYSNITSNTITVTDGNGISFDYNASYNNITANTITVSGTQKFGLSLGDTLWNIINYNVITASGSTAGGILYETNAFNNNASFNRLTSTATSGAGYGVLRGTNNTAISDFLNASIGNDILIGNGNITLLNTTYRRLNVSFSDAFGTDKNGTIFLKRYVTINVSNYTLSSLDSATVEVYNRTFHLVSNASTDSNGVTALLVLDEYRQNWTGVHVYTSHQFNASISGYIANFTTINLTANLDPLDITRTIYLIKSATPVSITDLFISQVNNNFVGGSWVRNLGNLTNISTNRPFIRFNVTGTATSYTLNLSVYSKGSALTGDNNANYTIALNNTNTDIYFNNTHSDDYYTWVLNASNSTAFNRTHNFAIIIDTTAPNISYSSVTTAGFRGLTQPVLAFPIDQAGSIFINVSTNDTANGKGQVSGGFVVFELHNSSGLLNRSIFSRNIFAADLVHAPAINISYKAVADLVDGTYYFNATVNDSLGNKINLNTRNVTIDRVSPSASVSAYVAVSEQFNFTLKADLTMKRLQTLSVTCSQSDINPANVTLTIDDGSLTCTGVSSCNINYYPTSSGTRTATCIVYDLAGHSSSVQKTIEVQQESTGGAGVGAAGAAETTPIGEAVSAPTETPVSEAAVPSEALVTTTGVLIESEQIIVPLSIDTVEQLILGEEAEQIGKAEEIAEQPVISEGEQAIPTAIPTETIAEVVGPVIAVVKTRQGNEILIRKGQVEEKTVIGITLRTPEKEKINIKYHIVKESKDIIEKPKLDLSFTDIKKINVQERIKYKILRIGPWCIII